MNGLWKKEIGVIITGPKSVAKMSFVKNAAKALFCRDPKDGSSFCGRCSACGRVERETHPDLIIWRDEDEPIIKVESIRELCGFMRIAPVEGRLRICIIDEAERMNKAAANAFLKTLEEPEPGCRFWLLTDRAAVFLPTLRSRCVVVGYAASHAQPSYWNREKEFELLHAELLHSRDPYRVTRKLKQKNDVTAFVEFLQRRERAVVLAKSAPGWEALRKFDRLIEIEARLRSNANYALLLETALREIYL
jgi:hypothetical protein